MCIIKLPILLIIGKFPCIIELILFPKTISINTKIIETNVITVPKTPLILSNI